MWLHSFLPFSLPPLTSALTPEWKPAALLMERRDELENNDTTEEEWCQFVGCLFCLHRLTVRSEEGRTVFYRLFNQCFPHKRFTQKFHRPILDWTCIWWNMGLSLLILTAAKVNLANQLSILCDFSFISFFNPSTRMMQFAIEVRNLSFMRTPVCTGGCRLVALIWPVHDDGNRMWRESFIRDWDWTGVYVWAGVNIHSAKV